MKGSYIKLIIIAISLIIVTLIALIINNSVSHAFTTQNSNLLFSGVYCADVSMDYYIENETTHNYDASNSAPGSGYIVNETASGCDSNNCHMYFDKYIESVTLNLIGAVNETISIKNSNNEIINNVITNETGYVNNVDVPIGDIKFVGSVSNYEKLENINSNTTDIKVMPENSLYWYGNECNWITNGWSLDGYTGGYTNDGLTKYDNYIQQARSIDCDYDMLGTMNSFPVVMNHIMHVISDEEKSLGYISLSPTKSSYCSNGSILEKTQTNIEHLFKIGATGNYYLSFGSGCQGYGTSKIYAIWMTNT